MDKNALLLEKLRKFRSRKFKLVGLFLLKLGISANLATSISIIFGIIAVYFLFQNQLLFIIFALSHLIIDGLDGVIARAANKVTSFGNYFDHLGDCFIGLLLVGKLWWVLQDYYILIIMGFFVLMNLIYFFSHMTYPWINFRTITIILLAFNLLTLTYLVAGVITVYALALQLKYFLENNFLHKN